MVEILKYITEFGFPIVLCVFLIIRFDKTIKELSNKLQELIIYLKGGE